MSNTIIKRDQFEMMYKLADVFQRSGRFSTERDVNQVIVKIQAGHELGLQPVQAMSNIHVISGKITLGASLIGALIKSSNKYNYKILELDNEKCSIEFYEKIDDKWEACGPPSVFTIDDASNAGLVNKDNWKKYTRNMLLSRALTNGARWYTPDVFGGPIYTPDELGDDGYVEEKFEIESSEYDDLFDISFADFKEKVKDEIADVDDDAIKKELSSAGFSWSVSSKREMFNHLQEKFDTSIEADYTDADLDVGMSDNV